MHRCSKSSRIMWSYKKIPQLQPIFLTAETLAQEDGNNFGKFEVIICGQTVKELTDKEMMQEYINKAKEQNVELVACGFSLNKFGVERKDISPNFGLLKTGSYTTFSYKRKATPVFHFKNTKL
jgi:intracellular sulfur oxidation DsrE/DsrF family protein